MAKRGTAYELKSVKAVRFTEDKTIAKLESDGWELVDRDEQLLWTEMEFRRALPKESWTRWLLPGVAFLSVIGMVIGVIYERSGADPSTLPASTTPATSTAPPAPPTNAPSPDSSVPSEDPESSELPDLVPWKDAPSDGVWLRGDVGFGETYTWAGGYQTTVVGAPRVLTYDDGENVTVSSTFVLSATREGSSLPWIDVLFWPGNDPERTANDDYGVAEWDCSPGEGDGATCTATFDPDDPDEVENFYWTVSGVSFGAWPSQTDSIAEGYHWVKVGSVTTTGSATGKRFTVNGHVRARYSFDFEPDSTYRYGDIGLRLVENGGCEGATWAAEARIENEQKGVLYFGFMSGKYCGSIHMPGPIWDRGTVKVTFEELRPE